MVLASKLGEGEGATTGAEAKLAVSCDFLASTSVEICRSCSGTSGSKLTFPQHNTTQHTHTHTHTQRCRCSDAVMSASQNMSDTQAEISKMSEVLPATQLQSLKQKALQGHTWYLSGW